VDPNPQSQTGPGSALHGRAHLRTRLILGNIPISGKWPCQLSGAYLGSGRVNFRALSHQRPFPLASSVSVYLGSLSLFGPTQFCLSLFGLTQSFWAHAFLSQSIWAHAFLSLSIWAHAFGEDERFSPPQVNEFAPHIQHVNFRIVGQHV
jgi:hypothetical protein